MRSWSRPAFATALQRLDLLVHREILRLRASYQLSLDEFRGLYISDGQVDALIRRQGLGQVDVSQLSAAARELLPRAQRELAQDRCWRTLCNAYELSRFEQDVVLLALAPDLHSKYLVLFAYLNNDVTRKFATVELALDLFADSPDQRRLLAGQGQLMESGLIVAIADQGDHQGLQSGFTLAPALREFLLDHGALAPALTSACELAQEDARDWHVWPFAAATVEPFRVFAGILREQCAPPLFVVESAAGSGIDQLAQNALAMAGWGCCRVAFEELPADRDSRGETARALCQLARLEHCGLLFTGLTEQTHGGASGALGSLLAQLQRAGVPCFLLVGARERWWGLVSPLRHLYCQIAPAHRRERQAYWRHHLDSAGISAPDEDLAAAADCFQLGYEQVAAAVDDMALRGTQGADRERLFASARRQSHGDMGELAERVDKNYRLADLVLPAAVLIRIRELISAISSRRRVFEEWGLRRRTGGASGMVALFSGASGTGKTMAASVIAGEIGLDLYRIELAGIVSKYIGETEKNLDRIFAAARKANCILFFDEADALFGKRSEVKDAHDRYANIEVAYLLQKIENHDGIVILTTNLAKSIDQAFTRRMQFIIEFPRPDVGQRELLWRAMLGDGVPVAAEVDFNFLARQLDNTGGEIRNMVLDAALMAAASEEAVIDMALLVRAAARQMMKQGKVPSAVEFKHYFNLVDNRTA